MEKGGDQHSEKRGLLILLALEELHISSESLGKILKRDPSGLRKLARRIKKKAACFTSLCVELETLRNSLHKIWQFDSQS